SILGSFTETERVVLAVGCEGGFSKKEMEMLDEAGFKHLHFNTNVLRAETAALYGIAVIQNAVMEKKSWREQE
ncbi:MAG: RNA methyltransferase, partial [Spirochaetaceae bacterium]|nr:RNA methyltransferase [Spirochaetaceae bacterium]